MLIAGTATVSAADQIVQATGQANPSDPSGSFVTPVTAVVAAPPTLSRPEAPFKSLLTGDGLEGWEVQEGKQSAWVRDGEIISCHSAAGGWLRTVTEYGDFELRLEYRLQSGGNTGVGLRCPPAGNPTFTGIEVQLLDDSSPKYASLRPDQYTGSIYYQVPATQKASLKPIGEWNQCEIVCRGDLLTIKINGELVNQVQLNRHGAPNIGSEQPKSRYLLSQRPPIGHIALQSHSTRVDFRKIELKDLEVRTESGLRYVDLSNGEGESASKATNVSVHYVGQLLDGKRFTDTRDIGEPVKISLASVIPGWKEGIQGMKVGGRRRLIVPPSLGYGHSGVDNLIPPNATLVFEVELCGLESDKE